MIRPNDATEIVVPLDVQNTIDQICDAFEDSWKGGQRPDISLCLPETLTAYWSTLVVELVRIDVAYRRKSGDTPSVSEYSNRFPQFAPILESAGLYTPDDPIQRLASIRQVGTIRLIEKVGSGSFGTVWKGWDQQLERQVAVKLPGEKGISAEHARGFEREARAAARLNHPGIVPVFGYEVDDGLSYIVYEFVEGTTLGEWARKSLPSPRLAAELCRNVAEALHYAHEHGVIHRDIKPANILVTPGCVPRITDFGMAKRDAAASTVVGDGVIMGTLAYMSPEQASGHAGSADGTTDVYALGAILYELLAKRRVFEGSARDLIPQILNSRPEPVTKFAPDAGKDLDTICLKCLQKQPADRYATAAELAEDLQRFLDGEPIKGSTLAIRTRIIRWVRKRKNALIVTATVILLFAIIITIDRRLTREQYKPPSDLNVPVKEASMIVRVVTEPPDAVILVCPCDPQTGIPQRKNCFAGKGPSPTTLNLLPGRYLVFASMEEDGGRSHEIFRTVPSLETASGLPISGNSSSFRSHPDGSIEWPLIEIPAADVTENMVFVAGASNFTFGEPDHQQTVSISPFYVSPREFSWGDFQNFHPGRKGNVPGKSALTEPGHYSLPARFDDAERWAEAAGCRLLTEIEFAYLADQAQEALEAKSIDPQSVDESLFFIAGGDPHDEIPTNPQIRGILSGFSEWTHSFPDVQSSNQTAKTTGDHDLRVIRAGHSRQAARTFEFFPTVGFRLARTAEPVSVVKD